MSDAGQEAESELELASQTLTGEQPEGPEAGAEDADPSAAELHSPIASASSGAGPSDAAPTNQGPTAPATPKVAASSGRNVTHIQIEGRDVYLIGTAHVSPKSVTEVTEVIREVRPDTVCVELDAMRHEAMIDENRWRKLDIFAVIKQQKVLFLLANLVLSAYQRRMGEKLGVKPGAELHAAVTEAEAVGAELVLADRDIQATLKRTWANLSFFNKLKVLGAMNAAFFGSAEIDEEQIEELKDRDVIGDMMREFGQVMPQVQVPLIDERDRYLMTKIAQAPGQKIVAVVGAGHVQGMLNQLGKTADLEELSRIPPPGITGRVLKWVIPAIVLCAFYYGYANHSTEGLKQMVFAWLIPNVVGAALLALLAGARPITVLVAGVASPITSLNPTIGAGMVAGLVEAWARKPTVEDCEQVAEITSFSDMRKNSFTRVLLVAVASTLGSAIGAWIGAAWVVKLL